MQWTASIAAARIFIFLLPGAAASNAALNDGLAAHYPFDDASGTLVADAVRGPQGAATLSDGEWVTGTIGGALQLDGIGDWVAVPNPLADGSQAATVAGWVWANSRPAWASIAKNWGNVTAGQFHLGLHATSGDLSNFLSNSTNVREGAATPFPIGQWQHVAFTYDGATHKLFRNGTLVASSTTQTPLVRNSATISLGVKTNDAGTAPDSAVPGWWDGKLDDFGIWSRALSEIEVALVHARGLQGFGIGDPEMPGEGDVIINEIMTTSGATPFRDEDGDSSDWIELFNPASIPADLEGWFLSDDPDRLTKWMFPSVAVPAGGYLVVFASDKDRRIPGRQLHTNFQLTSAGEFLALVRPDGVTVTSGFIPQFPAQAAGLSYGFIGQPPVARPLAPPTPGAANRSPAGPLVEDLTRDPTPPPGDDQPLLITARVTPNTAAVTSVTLHYRIQFQPVTTVPMNDDGGEGDAAAGDGTYSALIPQGFFSPGRMVRWAVTATDAEGSVTRMPPFPDPRTSPEFFGTVIVDPSINTQLPVLHRFVEIPARAELRSGARASVSFDGEFYDNVFIRQRGGTSAAWPKKSYKIDFNDGHHFRFRDGVPRVDEININTTYTDKSYVRSVLGYEHQRDAGQPSPEAFLVHCRQNAEFFSVAILVEQPDRDFLRRWNLDPDGSFYKGATAPTHYEPGTPISYWEKRTRRHEGTQDLSALLAGLVRTGAALETFLFDQVDLPRQINYMATTAITQNIDGSDKNHFLHRDTEGSGEWFMLPWDLDLTFGPDALNTDTIVFNRDSQGSAPSHPYIGARPWVLAGGKYNRFLEVIVANPRTKAMLNRRIRTLADEFLATTYFHDRIDALAAQIGPDVALDKARWGADAHFGSRDYTLTEAAERIKREYLDRRFGYLTLTQGQPGSGTALVHESTAPASALVPRDGSLGLSWTDPGFDDTSWIHGLNGIGYERGAGGEFEPLLAIDLLDPALPAESRIDSDGDNSNENDSVYIRFPFELANPAAVSFLRLKVKYDDGFIAYLNGTELARRNAPAAADWNASATGNHPDTQALVFENINVSSFLDRLRAGTNVLAVHALNDGLTGSDMLLVAALVDEAPASANSVGIPHAQPPAPPMEFGAIDFNPASGNQDEEFIEIRNPNSYPVDVSGWSVDGGVAHVFIGGTVILPEESLYLSPNAGAFRRRTTGPRGAQNLFVQGNYQGHLSNFGESLTLRTRAGTVVAETTLEPAPTDVQRHLVISEIMYHPAGGHPDAEFIELLNTSDSVTLDLSGVAFTRGVQFQFPAGASLAPGGRVVVILDPAAFAAAHPNVALESIAGSFASGRLANDGESLKLDDGTGSTVAEFTFDDNAPWPEAADGGGASLVLIDPRSHPDPNLAASWRASKTAGGSPGRADAFTIDEWMTAHGITGDLSADPDADGLGHLLEYVLGTDPHKAENVTPVTIVLDDATGSILVTIRRRAGVDDVQVVFESSVDLVSWSTALLEPIAVQADPDAPGVEILTFRPAMEPGGPLFIRVAVQR